MKTTIHKKNGNESIALNTGTRGGGGEPLREEEVEGGSV